EDGRVRASGALNDLLTRPDLPLSHHLDASAVIPAIVSSHDAHYHLSQVTVPGGELTVAYSAFPVGTHTRIRILARDVSVALQPSQHSSISNCLPCRILDISADRDPSRALLRLDTGGALILARLTR